MNLIKGILSGFAAVIFLWFLMRLLLPTQLDDVTLGIHCDEKLLDMADVYYVIPNFENVSLTENPAWCAEIVSRNKELAMPGVTHEYEEYPIGRSEDYLDEEMKIFEDCFGYAPTRFKPGQLKISEENKKLVEEKMELDLGCCSTKFIIVMILEFFLIGL